MEFVIKLITKLGESLVGIDNLGHPGVDMSTFEETVP
jgi:hypothetical protein